MHHPVMCQEVVDFLVTDSQGVYVDCTFGGGGHFKAIMAKTGERSKVIGIDQDPFIIKRARSEIDLEGSKAQLLQGNFRSLKKLMDSVSVTGVDGVLLDLGVSSYQLDEPERGFSYHNDSRLDMRMDPEQELSAWDVVNQWPQEDLIRILRDFGEERYASSIARGIVNARRSYSIDTTGQLVEVIKSNTPARYHKDKHPARRTFQALRIAVNDELGALEAVLPQAVDLLKPGGRLCVITFHSLEDRMVKEFMSEQTKTCLCPPHQPICNCGHKPKLKVVTKKPVTPTPEEISFNPRARSAKLRVAEKVEF